jgi:hypothetical protein
MSLRRKLLLPAGLAMATVLSASAPAAAQTPLNKPVYFTFSNPVSLPSVTLPAGRYLFQLASSQVQRNIIMVYSGDGAMYYGTFMTIPDQYATFGGTPPNSPEIRFMEAASGSPTPVRSYYYPGERTGYEFVYPRQQALKLAKAASEPVLTTAEDVSGNQMTNTELSRVDKTGKDLPADGQTANATENAAAGATASTNAANRTAQGEIATNVPPLAPAPGVNDSTAVTQSANAAPARTRLPQTASRAPLVLLYGVLALALGLGLRRRGRLF